MSTAIQNLRPPAPGTPRDRPAPRARLVSRRFALALLAAFGLLTSFYLLLSVTPRYAAAAGAGSAGAGLVTGSLMAATVAAELAAARLLRRFGPRAVLAAGAVLLGGPTLALLASHSIAAIIAVSIARGFGFGLATVVTGVLIATALPPGRRGEGIGLSGVVEGAPAIIALPSGVWLSDNLGIAVVVVLTAAAALLALAAVPGLGGPAGRRPEADASAADASAAAPAGLLAGLRSGRQRRPALVFAATTVSAGVITAFLPLTAGVPGGTAALGLLVQAAAATASGWWAGRHGDRHGHGGLLMPGLVIAAAGMAVLIWVAVPAALIAGLALFGTGFGIVHNATFALMIERVPASGYGPASALWNLAYDAGYGAGPVAFGVFAAATGYPVAFALTGVLMVAALVPAVRDRGGRRDSPARAAFLTDHE
jgi:MFS family permease